MIALCSFHSTLTILTPWAQNTTVGIRPHPMHIVNTPNCAPYYFPTFSSYPDNAKKDSWARAHTSTKHPYAVSYSSPLFSWKLYYSIFSSYPDVLASLKTKKKRLIPYSMLVTSTTTFRYPSPNWSLYYCLAFPSHPDSFNALSIKKRVYWKLLSECSIFFLIFH